MADCPFFTRWNSIVCSTTSANIFAYLVVDESFLTGGRYLNPLAGSSQANEVGVYETRGPFLPSDIEKIRASYQAGNFGGPYDVADCVSMYGVEILTTRRNILAITRPTNDTRAFLPPAYYNSTSLSNASGDAWKFPSTPTFWNGSSLLAFENEGTNDDGGWLCSGYNHLKNEERSAICSAAMARKEVAATGTWSLSPEDYPGIPYSIDYCLSEENVSQRCVLRYIPALQYLVVICNAIILLCMFGTIWMLSSRKDSILATTGDAVASFLDRPDVHTENMCLASLHNHRTIMKDKLRTGQAPPSLVYRAIGTRRLFSATSRTRWLITMAICGLYLLIGVLLLQASIIELKAGNTYQSTSEVLDLGFGNPDTQTAFLIRSMNTLGIVKNLLVANAFQIALSTTYYLYNSLWTAQCSALEWSLLAKEHQALRVTAPVGEQRSSWFLQLPYKYGIPLNLSLMSLHFLISQSIFNLNIEWYDLHDQLALSESTVGFSPVAILCSVCVGGTLMLAQGLHVLRPLDSRVPIHGNLSFVISAACHPLPSEREGNTVDSSIEDAQPEDSACSALSPREHSIAAKPLKWGAVRQARDSKTDFESRVGHCCLTAESVEMPITGRRYA